MKKIENNINKRIEYLLGNEREYDEENKEYVNILCQLKKEIALNCAINTMIYLYRMTAQTYESGKLYNNGFKKCYIEKKTTSNNSQRKRIDRWLECATDAAKETYLAKGQQSPWLSSGTFLNNEYKYDGDRNLMSNKRSKVMLDELSYSLICCNFDSTVIQHYIQKSEIANKNVNMQEFAEEHFSDLCTVLSGVYEASFNVTMKAMILYMLESHINIRFFYASALKIANLREKSVKNKELQDFLNISNTYQKIVICSNMYSCNILDRRGEYNYHNTFVIGLTKLFKLYNSETFPAKKIAKTISIANSIIEQITEEMVGYGRFVGPENATVSFDDLNFNKLDSGMKESISEEFCERYKTDVTNKMMELNDYLRQNKGTDEAKRKTKILSYYRKLYNEEFKKTKSGSNTQ